MASVFDSFKNDRTRFLVTILKLARDDGFGEVAFQGEYLIGFV